MTVASSRAATARTGWNWYGSNWKRPRWLQQAFADAAPFLPQLTKLALLPIFQHPDAKSFRTLGRITVRIHGFDAKRVPRSIRFKAPMKPAEDVSQPPQPASGMRTRWDMKLKHFFIENGGRQRIAVRFQLDDALVGFLWTGVFPLTVKTTAAQLLVANPRYDSLAGRWIEVDMLFDPNDSALQGEAEYNLALLVTDREDSSFVLPLIIDPRMENNG
jgi:hypothetical protein